jgi:hypothetical protein
VSAAYRVGQARMLIVALEALLELQVPLPPRRVNSREATLLTSLRVAREELDHALALLTDKHSTSRIWGVQPRKAAPVRCNAGDAITTSIQE